MIVASPSVSAPRFISALQSLEKESPSLAYLEPSLRWSLRPLERREPIRIGPSGVSFASFLTGVRSLAQGSTRSSAGSLTIVGGGGTPSEVVATTLRRAGGASAKVVVLPQASGRSDRGQDAAQMWRDAGAESVTILDPLDENAAEQLAEADLIWMPGGDQTKLMAAFEEAGVVDTLRARAREGAVVGGTSAGAAVMSRLMVAGRHANGEGLGLWPGVIVDQHFRQRDRVHRLMERVLDHPDKVGIGIDERTAVIVEDGVARVVGEGTVLVIDAREAQTDGALGTAKGVQIHQFRAGDSFHL